MSVSIYRIKTMAREDMDLMLKWALAEGWNPGRNDAECYLAADPKGFFVGVLGDEPIATISAVKYGESFGFLGFYIVKPQYRGQGYGLQIWRRGLEYLQGCNIGLDGVVAQQENYKKSGFKLAYRNIRYQGWGGSDAQATAEVVTLQSLPFNVVDAYERAFFPAERREFVRTWISPPGGHALGVMHNEVLTGYGVIRPCHEGYKIGPLVADNAALADTLLCALKATTSSSERVFVDVPESNPAARRLVQRHGMESVFETARMYTGEEPLLPVSRIFGVTSFEVG